MGKIIVIAIISVLGYQNQVAVLKYIGYLKDVSSVIQTYTEIDSFKAQLTEYANENEGRLPENLGEWLNQNFKSAQKNDMSLDHFGTPYQVVLDQGTANALLISCGPDKACGTDDDIELRL